MMTADICLAVTVAFALRMPSAGAAAKRTQALPMIA